MKKRSISLLGSTGSIGRQTLEVVRELQIPVLALTAMKLIEDPKLVEQAQAEWRQQMKGIQYICPIPPEVQPPVIP